MLFKGKNACINLILRNRKYSFKITSSYGTGLSDHDHLIYSVTKTILKCEEPKKYFIGTIQVFSERFPELGITEHWTRKK